MKAKAVNTITYYMSLFFEKLLSRKSFFTKSNTMLIVRLDSIGDYILFRNFIHEIKKSDVYSKYKITILGNRAWKDIAETFDKQSIEKFIWVEKNIFGNKGKWRDKFLTILKIHLSGYEILLLPNDTRTKHTEYIEKYSGSKKVIDDSTSSIFFLNELDDIFQKNISSNGSPDRSMIFQFNRNKKFAELLTGKKIDLKKPEFKTERTQQAEDFIIIFPGAGHHSRKWSNKNFAEVCKKIYEHNKIRIIICGDIADKDTAREIASLSGTNSVEDMTGKTRLPQLIKLISNARLLISNETCAIHIAASVDTPAICISNGNHFGRFNPYPKEMAAFIQTIYPDVIAENQSDYFYLVKKYHINSDIDINLITPDSVFNEVLIKLNNPQVNKKLLNAK